MTANRRPSTAAWSTDSRVTGPPMLTPAAHPGNGTCGRGKSTWPGSRYPNTTWTTTRMTITIRPNRKKTARERDHGAAERRAATPNTTTTAMNANSLGFVVRTAATPMVAAHTHHAAGWSVRPSAVMAPRDAGATGRGHHTR